MQASNLPGNLIAQIDAMPTLHKIALLSHLIEWADSPEGQDMRAAMAHAGANSPVTAADVLALCDKKFVERVKEELGI